MARAQRLRHHRLEKAIYERRPIAEMLGRASPLLDPFAVVDYVGHHQLDEARFQAADPVKATAQVFFEDQGAYQYTHDGTAHGRSYNLAVFATFLVLEIEPHTQRTQFLVLAPRQPAGAEGGAYIGLMASNAIADLERSLQSPSELEHLWQDLDELLDWLAGGSPSGRQRRSLWARLLGR